MCFLGGGRWLTEFTCLYCSRGVISTLDFLKTDAQLDERSKGGTGLMLFINVPVM